MAVVALVVMMAGLGGCTGVPVRPPSAGVSSDSTSAANSVICDQAGLEVPPTVMGKPRAADYPSGVNFAGPVYPSDVLGVDRGGEQVIAAAPGTPEVGVLIVKAPGQGPESLWTGVVGVDLRAGTTVWGINLTGVGGPAAVATVSSNGVDRLAVMMKQPAGTPDRQAAVVETVDAASGHVLWAYSSPDPNLTVMGMAGSMIAIIDEGVVTGYQVNNLSAAVWQRPGTGFPPEQATMDMFTGSLLIGQDVVTSDGYVSIQDGTPASFGADAGWSPAYIHTDDGSVFRVSESAGGLGFQRYDPGTGQPVWAAAADVQVASGCGSECTGVASNGGTVVSACQDGNLCGYDRAGGRLVWLTAVEPGSRGGVGLMGIAGQFVFASVLSGSKAAAEVTAVQAADGENVYNLGTTPVVLGQCLVYGWSDQELTAYDASTGDLGIRWTTAMPTTGQASVLPDGLTGDVEVVGGQLAVVGADGGVWLAQPAG